MKKLTFLACALLSSSVAAEFKITEQTAPLGQSNQVTLEGKTTFNLVGDSVKVGDLMPSAKLLSSDLKVFDTSQTNEKARVYTVITSVDTPVCVQQSVDLAKYLKENKEKFKNVEFYVVSSDTPFAQQRFIREYKLEGLPFLSDSVNHELGHDLGAQIKELGLLTRSIIVVDKDNKIKHIQRVPELTTIPNIEKAVEFVTKA